jgi:hypothetical protein
MCTLLLIYTLSVESSYLQNVEQEAKDAADTIQFCLKDGEAWRIKTFATDHDVHVWSIGRMTLGELEELADKNTRDNYGDVLVRRIKILAEPKVADLTAQLIEAGLPAHLESPEDGNFMFWVHTPDLYRTRSTPQ